MKTGNSPSVIVSAPGRICLIGEHQDYLGLHVISGALNLFVRVKGSPIEEKALKIHLKSVNMYREISLDIRPSPLQYRDYLQSGMNVMLSRGLTFRNGYDVDIWGDLPIGKGVSSSSALNVAWITFLSHIAHPKRHLNPIEIARAAFQSEVQQFDEPGGMQDHIASALGGLVYMNFSGGRAFPEIQKLSGSWNGFLLVDSGSTKETIGMLQSIRDDIAFSLKSLSESFPEKPALSRLTIQDIPKSLRSARGFRRLMATVINRNLTQNALNVLNGDHKAVPGKLGKLMNAHHGVLRELLGTSTPRIDALCRKALEFGALGAKVIGSGGGGCLLVYAPENTSTVIRRFAEEGVSVTPVEICNGVSVDILDASSEGDTC